MTMNDNAEERQEAAAAKRERDAASRDDAAIKRDGAAQVRDSAAALRHEELRHDIEETQHLVTGGTGDVIFRVEGLQDKFFEHLIFATNAIEDATAALEAEKRTRKIQIAALAAAVILGMFVGIFTLLNARNIETVATEREVKTCEAINQNRDTLYAVLERLAYRTGTVSPENEALLEEFREGPLRHLDC